MHLAGYAPFLDYHPLTQEEQALALPLREQPWFDGRFGREGPYLCGHTTSSTSPQGDPTAARSQISKTKEAVNERLTKEISYWDNRAAQLKEHELTGKVNAKLNSQKARQRAEELYARLERRMQELDLERRLVPLPPVVVGGVLVIPQGLLMRLKGEHLHDPRQDLHARLPRPSDVQCKL